jgi:hypothetical protein
MPGASCAIGWPHSPDVCGPTQYSRLNPDGSILVRSSTLILLMCALLLEGCAHSRAPKADCEHSLQPINTAADPARAPTPSSATHRAKGAS